MVLFVVLFCVALVGAVAYRFIPSLWSWFRCRFLGWSPSPFTEDQVNEFAAEMAAGGIDFDSQHWTLSDEEKRRRFKEYEKIARKELMRDKRPNP